MSDLNEIEKALEEEAPKAPSGGDLSGRDYVVDATPIDVGGEAPEVKGEGPKPKKEKKKMSRTAIIVLVAALVLALAAAAWFFFLRPGIKFSTKRPVAEAGEEFDAMSIVEGVRGGDASDISVYGPKGKLAKGVYKYTFDFRGKTTEVTVTVKDTTAPKLTLKEDLEFSNREEIKGEDIAEAEDEGKVTLKLDPQGNDLTKVGMYEVLVTAEDEDKNKSEIKATITIVPYDTEGPKISGATNTTIIVYNYFDPMAGVTVTDNKDPNPTIVADLGGFDYNTVGNYTIKYTARDESGNETVVERVISVNWSPIYTPGYDPSVSWDASGEWGQPYLVAVNRAMCCVTVYGQDANGNYTVPVTAFPCSVGREGHETPLTTVYPVGRFHSDWRADWCLMIDNSYGRYAIHINTEVVDPALWGYMFHSVCYFGIDQTNLEYEEYNKLGGPASLGCIRLCVRDEKWLYDNCPEGFPIIIYDDYTSPGPLGKPDPIRIDVDDWRRGWDPTDPDPNNPWNW